MSGTKSPCDAETHVIPVVEETLDIQKRRVETGGVRCTKVVREREELVDEPLIRDEVIVKRLAVNCVVESPPAVRQEGNSIIIPVLEEILVVEKRLILKEELHITTRRVEAHTPQTVTVRSEEVIVERRTPQDPLTPSVRKEH
jgi:uncharacterized protein (TIGR02271 family)